MMRRIFSGRVQTVTVAGKSLTARSGWKRLPVTLIAIGIAAMALTPAAAGTLDRVRARDNLVCLLPLEGQQDLQTPGFAGGTSLFEADLCRAMAIAILGQADRASSLVVSLADRVDAIITGDGDISFGFMTATASRNLRIEFPVIYYHDAQGFLAPAGSSYSQIRSSGATTVCVVRGSSNEGALADRIASEALPFILVPVGSTEALVDSYTSGRCRLASADISTLISQRIAAGLSPERHVILEETISHEPVGPMVPANDPDWAFATRWIINGLLVAEERGITRDNVLKQRETATDPVVRRLLGLEPHPLMDLGLPADCLVRVIQSVGNYAEMFDRAFGPKTAYSMPRGKSRLLRDGGVLYAQPYR